MITSINVNVINHRFVIINDTEFLTVLFTTLFSSW
jgi:hypothetical protein